MAMDFPNPPLTNGQQFTNSVGSTYTWDGIKWTISSVGGGTGGASQITGPLTIGVTTLVPPPVTASLVSDQMVVRATGLAPGTIEIGLNAYTDSSGVSRYVGNGPAGDIAVFGQTAAGVAFNRLAMNIAPANTQGPGAAITGFTGGLNIVEGMDTTGNPTSFVVLGSGGDVPPQPFPVTHTLVANQISVKSVIPTVGSESSANVALNIYNDVGGNQHYLGNGAGGLIDAHDRGSGVSRITIGPYDVNAAGAGNMPGSGGTGNPGGGMQVVFGQPGVQAQPFVTVGIAAEVPISTFPRRATLIANELTVRSDALGATGTSPPDDRVARFGMNAFVDNTTVGNWLYLTTGPAGSMTVHDANVGAHPLPATSWRISLADPGNQYAAFDNSPKFVIYGLSGTGTNQTNLMLLVNTTGTPTLTQVQVGAAGTGPGGSGHMLFVP